MMNSVYRRFWVLFGGVGAAIGLGLMFGTVCAAAPFDFPSLSGPVVDDAHVLSPAATRTLVDELGHFHQDTGHSVVVVTVASLQGQDVATYGVGLFRAWQLGRKGRNDGVILLIAPNDRRDRIEVGYGLEPALTDAESSRILRDVVHPYLKSGDYDGAALAGERAIARAVSEATSPAKPVKSRHLSGWEALALAAFGGFIALLLTLFFGWIGDLGKRNRRYGAFGGAFNPGPASGLDTSSSVSDSGSASSMDSGGSAGGGGASDSW